MRNDGETEETADETTPFILVEFHTDVKIAHTHSAP